MFKRLILSVLLLCAAVPVRAAEYSGDLSNIQSTLYEIWDTLDIMWGEVSYIQNLIKDPGSYNWYMDITQKLLSFKEHLESIDTIASDIYPKFIQQYYHVISLDAYADSIDTRLHDLNLYISQITEIILALQSVIEDYENFKSSITVPLNNIDSTQTEMGEYVRAIYEDVDTIKALFLGESNLREMLETLWDIKNDVEYFQQQWDAQNTDIHEMFLDPFDNSGFQESYEASWNYFDRTFDPHWTWSNGTRLISVVPSNWGAFDDICSGLLAILQGNEAMNYNLEYLCQGVTIIASNLMNGVNMEAKYNEYKNEFQERSASAQQDYSSLIGYEDKFYIYKSPEIIHIHDTIRGHINETFSPFIVNEMPAGNLSLFGLSGFGDSGVDHVQGVMDMESFGFFFVAARFCFGFLYWILNCVFVWWCLSVAIKMYKMTLNWFTALPQQVG